MGRHIRVFDFSLEKIESLNVDLYDPFHVDFPTFSPQTRIWVFPSGSEPGDAQIQLLSHENQTTNLSGKTKVIKGKKKKKARNKMKT